MRIIAIALIFVSLTGCAFWQKSGTSILVATDCILTHAAEGENVQQIAAACGVAVVDVVMTLDKAKKAADAQRALHPEGK